MTGTDKILRHIADQAEEQSRQIAEETRARTEQLEERLVEELSLIREDGVRKAEALLADRRERTASALALKKRQALLAVKGQLVSEAIGTAYEQLIALPDEEYFDFLIELLTGQDLSREGTLYLNAQDLARQPASFAARVNELTKLAGGTLSLNAEPADIDGGFILRYGGIEENCSFRALFDAQEDAMKDAVRAVLFAGTP